MTERPDSASVSDLSNDGGARWAGGFGLSAIVMASMLLGCAHHMGGGAAGGVPGETTQAAAPADGPFGALERGRAALAHCKSRRDSTQSGGLKVDWVAYFDRDSLRFARETIQQAPYGLRTNEYAFEDGRLRGFASSGAVSLTGPPDDRGPYTMRIAFGVDGTTTASEKIVSGAKVALEEYEPGAALGRAEWLRAQIRSSASQLH